MGMLSDFRRIIDIAQREHDQGSVIQLHAEPWATHQLAAVVFHDITGLTLPVIDRAAAMRVPAVTRARALICGVSRYPLAVYDSAAPMVADPVTGELVDPDPLPAGTVPWLTDTATPQSPRLRLLWTYDDLLFSGLSMWAVTRDSDGKITDAYRIPRNLWTVDDKGQILWADQPVSREQVILFEGPQEGLLTLAADTIRAALDMTRAWADRVKAPVPMVDLHSTDPAMNLTEDEATDLVARWEKVRSNGGGVAYTPAGIQANIHAGVVSDLYIQGRNALRLDIANLTSLPAALLEGSMSTASLTYSTREGQRSDLADLSLGYWTMPLEARLSQDDVVPAGRHIAHDLRTLSTPNQPSRSPAQED